MRTQTIPVEPAYILTPFIKGGTIVAFNVEPSGDVLLLIAREALDDKEVRKRGAIFPKTKPETPQHYEVLRGRNGKLLSLWTIKNEPFNIHDIQPLPNNQLLLVCARSHYKGPNDYEKNGRIYSIDGEFIREILLGDGIQSTQVTASGEIWSSYFDEGVFGNFGWHDPVGASGLVARDSTGDTLYQYAPTDALDDIADCYALNVASDSEVWCYYYTEFPLVQIREHQIVNYWHPPLSGSDAFAIAHRHALFRGGYDEKDAFYLLELKTGHTAITIAKFKLVDHHGNPFKNAWVVGRKNHLYILDREKIATFSVEDALAKHWAAH